MTSELKLLIQKDKLMFSQIGGYMIMYSILAVVLSTLMGSFSSYPLLLSAIFFSTATCSSVVHEEEQSKCNMLMFTLPVKTQTYLTARYIYFALYPIKMITICAAIGFALNLMFLPDVRNIGLLLRFLQGFIMAGAVSFLFPGIFVPLYYAIGTTKSKVVFALIAFFTTILTNFTVMSGNSELQASSFILPLIFLVVSIIGYYISYRISLVIIRKSRIF